MGIRTDPLITSNFIIPERINFTQYKKSKLTEYFNSIISSNLSFESKYSSEKITLFYLLSTFFDIEKEFLVENIRTVYEAVLKARPASVKGQYLKKITISSTMGPSVLIDHLTL